MCATLAGLACASQPPCSPRKHAKGASDWPISALLLSCGDRVSASWQVGADSRLGQAAGSPSRLDWPLFAVTHVFLHVDLGP